MPVTLAERFSSPRHTGGKDPRWDYSYVATGSDDEYEVRDAVLASTPAFVDGLPRQDIQVEHIGLGAWDVVVPYTRREASEPPPPATEGASEYEFDVSTETARVRQSLQTMSAYSAALVPVVPDFQGAINVQDDAVEGADILVPTASFSETHWLNPALVTAEYRRQLAGMVGTMNAAPFRGYAAREVLLVGCRGRFRDGDELAQITFSFRVSFGRSDIQVGAMIGIVKDGHDYLWVRYGRSVDPGSNTVVQFPANAYVERVYRESDFALLGIGA